MQQKKSNKEQNLTFLFASNLLFLCLLCRTIRSDRRNYIEILAVEAEAAAHHCNTQDMYSTIKKLSGKFIKPERPVKDRYGRMIPDEEGQNNRWVEHFEELLNKPSPPSPPDILPAASALPIDCSAIKQLKNGKSARPDSKPVEALKADVEELHPLFNKI